VEEEAIGNKMAGLGNAERPSFAWHAAFVDPRASTSMLYIIYQRESVLVGSLCSSANSCICVLSPQCIVHDLAAHAARERCSVTTTTRLVKEKNVV